MTAKLKAAKGKAPRKDQARKATKPNRAKAKPKPKAKLKPRPSVTTERLTWEGAELHIMYKTHAFGEGSTHAHLEVRAMNPLNRPLPITETGYRSHFLPRGCVQEAGGPSLYAKRWLDEAARSPQWKLALARWRQLELFPSERLG